MCFDLVILLLEVHLSIRYLLRMFFEKSSLNIHSLFMSKKMRRLCRLCSSSDFWHVETHILIYRRPCMYLKPSIPGRTCSYGGRNIEAKGA